jgi:Arc-like DNA binding domain
MPRKHSPNLPAEGGVRALVTRTLRFDESLHRQLEEAAKRYVRSVNSEIIFRLMSTFWDSRANGSRLESNETLSSFR